MSWKCLLEMFKEGLVLWVSWKCLEMFSFIEFDYTRKMEVRLDDVASDRDQYLAVVKDTYALLSIDIARVTAAGTMPPRFPCPSCGKALQRRSGSAGVFWSCSGYQEGCTVSMDDDKGTPVARKSFPCPVCEAPMHRKKGDKGFFWGCSGYKEGCKTTLPDDKGKPGKRPEVSAHRCPECNKPLIHRKKLGKSGFDFWGCTGYPDCKKTYQSSPKGLPVLSGQCLNLKPSELGPVV